MDNTKYQITKTVRFKLEPYVVTNDSQTEEEKEAALKKETARIKEELLQIRPNSSDEMSLDFYLNDKGNDESLSDLKSLNDLLGDSIDELEHLIYLFDGNDNVVKSENKKVWSSIEIKYGFLRSYLKSDFYRFKEAKYGLSNEKPPKKYKLDDRDIQFFRDEVAGSETRIGLIPRLQEIQRLLADFTDRQEVRQYEKKRFSDIALVLGNLTKRDNLVFLKALASALVIPNNDQKGLDTKKNELVGVITSIEAIVNQKLSYYTPFKSAMGYQTRGGSFNYYTINKDEKELQDEEKSLTNEMKGTYRCNNKRFGGILSTLKVTYKVFVEFYAVMESLAPENKKNKKPLAEYEKIIIQRYGLENKDMEATLQLDMEEMYKFIKLWKGRQKTDYKNALSTYDSDPLSKKTVDGNLLFKFFDYRGKNYSKSKEELFANLKRKQQQLTKWSNEKSNDRTSEQKKKELAIKIKDIREEIGKIFLKRQGLDNYTKLCDYFKALAIRYGEIKARLAGIEKDKVAAKLLHYWCVIVEEDGEKHLYLIPRFVMPASNESKKPKDSIQAAYEEVSDESKSNAQGNCKVYYFESLTLAALRKLCFKENNNSFRKDLPKNFPKCEQRKSVPDIDENGRPKLNYDGTPKFKDVPTTEIDRIKNFQIALNVLVENGTLLLDTDSSILSKSPQDFGSLGSFEIELNRCCYKKLKYVQDGFGDKLVSEYKAIRFKISNKDFEKNTNRCFTTDIWQKFWDDSINEDKSYPIRLNPEVKVFWRVAKPSRIDKYENNPIRKAQDFANRYTKEQFTVAFTFTENALTPRADYGFVVNEKPNSNRNNRPGKQENAVPKTLNLEECINKFNSDLNNKYKFNFAIGIDVGTNDLALATFVELDGNKYKPLTIKALEIRDAILDINNPMSFKTNAKKKLYFYEDRNSVKYFTNEILYNAVFGDGLFQESLQKYDCADGIYQVKEQFKKDFKEGFRIYRVVENPSYFLNKDLYDLVFDDGKFEDTKKAIFEEKDGVASINLTTAKVINVEIVLNVDHTTHQKIMILNAERHISREAREDNNGTIVKDGNTIALKNNNYPTKGKTLYFDKGYDFIQSFDDVFAELKKYNALMSVDLVKIEDRINNYRKALVANMVGVLTNVFNRLSNLTDGNIGYIALEGLDEGTIQSHFDKFEGDITIPLRIALLKKFQVVNQASDAVDFVNLVPPFAEIAKLDDEKKFMIKSVDTLDRITLEKGEIKTYGIIRFVSEHCTSDCCPKCGKNMKKDSFQYPEENGLHSINFRCTCGFDTCTPHNDEFDSIKTTDMVAAFNIAKRAI